VMSRYDRYRRFAAFAACVGSTTAIAALGGAAPAMASTCDAGPVYSSGSSLQAAAQELWEKEWPANTKCTKTPTITYAGTSSGEGLEEFGANSGELNAKENPTVKALEEKGEPCGPKDTAGQCLDIIAGTDDPPTGAQIGEASAAAGAATGQAEITVPVAEGPVAVALSLPAGCKIANESKVDLNNTTITQLWEGLRAKGEGGNAKDLGGIQAQGGFAANTWGALLHQLGYTEVGTEKEVEEKAAKGEKAFASLTAEETLTRHVSGKEETVETQSLEEVEKSEGPKTVKVTNQQKVLVKGDNCSQEITAQVRAAESGTSYAFKSYLAQINHSVWGEFANDFVQWPGKSNVAKEDPVTSTSSEAIPPQQENKKGGQLAEDTAATTGSVGYANTADAVKSGTFTESAKASHFGTGKVEEVVEEEVENKAKTEKVKVKVLKSVSARSVSHQILWGQIQNTGTGAAPLASEYANPLIPSTKTTECETEKLVPGDSAFPYSYKDSWAGIVSTDPSIHTIGAADYPICALTYDLAWHHYGNKNLYGPGKTVLAEEMANTAKDLMEYITGKGQTDVLGTYYSSYPSAMKAHIHEAAVHVEL
jgi:ABC-type phosphate transport system substrate-binding protein